MIPSKTSSIWRQIWRLFIELFIQLMALLHRISSLIRDPLRMQQERSLNNRMAQSLVFINVSEHGIAVVSTRTDQSMLRRTKKESVQHHSDTKFCLHTV